MTGQDGGELEQAKRIAALMHRYRREAAALAGAVPVRADARRCMADDLRASLSERGYDDNGDPIARV